MTGNRLHLAAAAVIVVIGAVVVLAALPPAVDWSLIGVQAAVAAWVTWLTRPRWEQTR